MIIGFTGTQIGMTNTQVAIVSRLVRELSPTEAHHGDCVGADSQFHKICEEFGVPVVIHPPENPCARAFCVANTIRPEKLYLDRNHDIVDESDFLIVAPKENTEQLRSGTWATFRYANKIGRELFVVSPLLQDSKE